MPKKTAAPFKSSALPHIPAGMRANYVVWLQPLPNPTDTPTLIPFLEDMREQLPFTYQNIVADAGYEREKNYSYLKTHGQLAYIKPANYEISKTRKYQNDIANRENMVYEKEKDCYYCSQGKVLQAIGTKTKKTATGYVSTKTLYRCEACTTCDMSVAAHDLHEAAVLPERLTFFHYLCVLAGIARRFTAIPPPQATNR